MKTLPIEVDGRTLTMREPTIRDYRDVQGMTDGLDRNVELFGRIVLGEDGKPIGIEAVLDFPARAITDLSLRFRELQGDGDDGEPIPLAQKNGSAIASPSH